MTSAVEKVKKQYERDLRRAEIEDQISSALGPVLLGLKPHVHVHDKPLFGDVAWITFGDRYGTLVMDMARAKEIATAITPIESVLVRKGSVSFEPKTYFEAHNKEHVESVSDVAPVWLQIEHDRESPTVAFQWYGKIENEIVRATVFLGRLGMWRDIASVDVTWKNLPGKRVVSRQSISLGSEMHALHGPNGDVITMAESPIRWASGGAQYPNPYTIYYASLAPEMPASTLGFEMVSAIAKICEE